MKLDPQNGFNIRRQIVLYYNYVNLFNSPSLTELPFRSTWFLQARALTQPRQTVRDIFRQHTPPSTPILAAPDVSSACLPVCLPCFDSGPGSVHSHAQQCSSINKGLPFLLSTPPWPLWDLKPEGREKMKMKSSDSLLISIPVNQGTCSLSVPD